MNEYMQTLANICFTMITGVVIVASVSAIVFMGFMLHTMITDYLND